MLAEIRGLFSVLPPSSSRDDYLRAIIEDNVLGKQTHATHRLTSQRLKELYGLDRKLSLFRVFRLLWDRNAEGRPLLAMKLGGELKPRVVRRRTRVLEVSDPDEVVALIGASSVYGFLSISEVIREAEALQTAAEHVNPGTPPLAGEVRRCTLSSIDEVGQWLDEHSRKLRDPLEKGPVVVR